MKNFWLLPILLLASQIQAQDFPDGEARETLRFLRLAETKKRLNLDDAKLLKLNEYLDQFEDNKFDLRKRQTRLMRQIQVGKYDDGEAARLLAELVQVKREEIAADALLWENIQKMLTPRECLEVIKFYENFQREVRRRISALQDRKLMRPGGRKN